MLPYCAGDWPSYDSIAGDNTILRNRITELEQQLAAMQRIIDGYKDDLRADTPTEKKLFNALANSWHKKAVEDAETIKELKDQIKVMQALSGETITEKPSVTATQYSPCGECENCYRSLPCPEEEKQCN